MGLVNLLPTCFVLLSFPTCRLEMELRCSCSLESPSLIMPFHTVPLYHSGLGHGVRIILNNLGDSGKQREGWVGVLS